MIKRESEMQVEVRKEMRGGKGEVELRHIFSKDELTGKCRLLAKITLAPGCSIGLHEHAGEEEIYYIINGRARVHDNGTTADLSVGDQFSLVEKPSIENIGDELLGLLQ